MRSAAGHAPADGQRGSAAERSPLRDSGPGVAVETATPRPLAAGCGRCLRSAVVVARRAHLSPRRRRVYRHPSDRTTPAGARRAIAGAAGRPSGADSVLARSWRAGAVARRARVSLRLVDVHGHGRHQDFLLVTSADGPLLHHLLLPGVRGFLGQSFSSLLPYRLGGRLRLVGAQPARQRERLARGALAELVELA